MAVYVALLRAVNVGGTGKLPMGDLVRLAEAAGCRNPGTYIASGNLLFESDASEPELKTALERVLATYAGKKVGVLIRTAAELAAVLAANPFAARPPARTAVFFLDNHPPSDLQLSGPAGEEVRAGRRELYVYCPGGMGRSRLRLPGAHEGTARNVNTVTRLAALAAARQEAIGGA